MSTTRKSTKQHIHVCIHNPPLLVRRPISDLLEILKNQIAFSLLTPNTHIKLHHEDVNEKQVEGKNLDKQTQRPQKLLYNTITPHGGFAWPIPLPGFFTQIHKAYKENTIFHIWTNAYLSVIILIFYIKCKNMLRSTKTEKRKIIISLDTMPAETFKFDSWLDTAFKLYNATIGKILLNAADAITIYSEELRPILKKQGITTPIHYTPTGIEKKQLDAKALQKPKDVPPEYIFMLGIPNMRKGMDILLNIAKKMPQKQFVHVGDGKQLSYWKTKAKKEHITNISFLGIRKDVPALVTNASCVLLPSRGEGLAGILMEAMIYGSPVVSSNIFGTRELITHNKEGILVETENVSKYIQAIQTVTQNNTFRKKLIANAKRKITHFSWSKNKKRFLEVYKCVA